MTYDVSHLKLGKLAPEFPEGLDRLTAYRTDPFPTPPAGILYPAVPEWGMDGNDTLGDCTIAGVDHLIAAWNQLFGETDKRPTLKAIEAEYKVLSPHDQGCVESKVLAKWRKPGLFGNKIALYVPADHTNETELKQVIAFTGGVYLGIQCPASAQQEFAEQEQTGKLVPWTYNPQSQIEGGHCIVGVGYDADGMYCVSWGAVVLVTWEFLAHLCEEAWAVLSHELVEKGSDTLGLDIAKLTADLDAL